MASMLGQNKTLETLEIGNLMVGCKVKLKSSGEVKVVTSKAGGGDITVEGDGSRIKPSDFDAIPAVLPLKQLRENAITELNLSNSGLGVDGGIMLAAAMTTNTSVKWLDARNNSLDAESKSALRASVRAGVQITV